MVHTADGVHGVHVLVDPLTTAVPAHRRLGPLEEEEELGRACNTQQHTNTESRPHDEWRLCRGSR